MNLRKALRLGDQPRLAFVGAGGKSAALFHLARQFDGSVLLAASTHLAAAQLALADRHIVVKSNDDLDILRHGPPAGVTLLTGPLGQDERTAGLSLELLDVLYAIAEQQALPLLIEADGSRQRPLKAPAAHEPALPAFVDTVVVVAGLSGLGQPLGEEWVHRPQIFGKLTGLAMGAPITTQALARVLCSPQGGLKNIPPAARRVLLLTQADTPRTQAAAQSLAGELLPAYHAVLTADFNLGPEPVLAAHEPVAGVVLAAGASRRLGEPKQLLDWRGEPFIRQVTRTALQAGLSPVVVVIGAHAEMVEAAIQDLPVTLVRNHEWEQGQSTSLRAGLAALPAECGAAIFLLVDQPQVPATLLRALAAAHASSLAPIIAPQVDGKRGNPVLFDRLTFPELVALSGDVGGRALFSRHSVTWLPWLDASLALDVDTLEDYNRLLNYDDD